MRSTIVLALACAALTLSGCRMFMSPANAGRRSSPPEAEPTPSTESEFEAVEAEEGVPDGEGEPGAAR